MSDVPIDASPRPVSAGPISSRRRWDALREFLPQGRTLSSEDWWHRHRAILGLIWFHAVAIPVFALVRGYPPSHGALEALPVAIPAVFATLDRFGRTLRTQAAAFGLLSSSAVLVHLSGGTIEMHFHFFVMVTVVALYQDWFPFLMAIAYVFAHHGMLGLLDATSVYNHPAALNNPWKWAAIHALFISGISTVCLITWRVNERALASRRAAEEHAERLYELERSARSAAEEAGQRLSVLSEASRVLVSSLDLDATLRRATGAWVPAIADVCLVDLVREDGRVHRIGRVDGPDGPALAEELAARPPDLTMASHPVARVYASGLPELIEHLSAEDLRRAGIHTEGDLLERIDPTSAMVVPLHGREGVLGVISFVTTGRSERRFGAADLALAEEIARRTAAAVENARLYARERGVAESLQRSLLPETLPRVPGIEAAARYSPGGPNLEVGGDWYDVVVRPGGAIAIAMGDVVGRGLPAAALMGQLRNALRVYALDGMPPAEALGRLNRLLQANDLDHLATLVYAVFDPGSGTLRLGNAGHPPPLVLGPDGAASFVDQGHCLPLGAMPHADYTETVTSLAPGSTLVLYTDGLVEDRETSLTDGLAKLSAAVRGGPGEVTALCDHILARMVEDRNVDDDVALMLFRPQALGNPLELRMPSDSRMLAPLRTLLRRWLGEHRLDEDDLAANILLGTGEAAANAIEHAASAGDTEFEVVATAGDGVHVVVRDHGTWRPPRPRGGGRGLHVMEAVADRIEVVKNAGGTEVHLWFGLARGQVTG